MLSECCTSACCCTSVTLYLGTSASVVRALHRTSLAPHSRAASKPFKLGTWQWHSLEHQWQLNPRSWFFKMAWMIGKRPEFLFSSLVQKYTNYKKSIEGRFRKLLALNCMKTKEKIPLQLGFHFTKIVLDIMKFLASPGNLFSGSRIIKIWKQTRKIVTRTG